MTLAVPICVSEDDNRLHTDVQPKQSLNKVLIGERYNTIMKNKEEVMKMMKQTTAFFHGQGFTAEHIPGLLAYLADLKEIDSVIFNDNNLGDEGVRILSEGLVGMPQIKRW